MRKKSACLAAGLCLCAVLAWATGGGSSQSQALAVFASGGCVGAVDGDLDTDLFDFLDLLMSWGPCPDPPEPCDADLDGDGEVGVMDFLIVLGDYGCGLKTCESSADCDDGDPCTFDLCLFGSCLNFPICD